MKRASMQRRNICTGFKCATINVRGINQARKRKLLDKIAKVHVIDFMFMTETKYAYSSIENAYAKVMDKEPVKGDYILFQFRDQTAIT